MSAPLEGTASAAGAIARVKYTHDALIDAMIANPAAKQGQLAKLFGYTESWISRIVNSDAFQARLAARKADIVDPVLTMTIDEKLKGLASQSLDILAEKLELTRSPDLAYKAAELSLKAAGYGARQQNVAVQQNFVVALPAKAASVEEWEAKFNGGVPLLTPDQVTDINPA